MLRPLKGMHIYIYYIGMQPPPHTHPITTDLLHLSESQSEAPESPKHNGYLYPL